MIVPTEILKRLVAIEHPALKDHAFTRVEIFHAYKKVSCDPTKVPSPDAVRVVHVTVGDLVRDLIEARE